MNLLRERVKVRLQLPGDTVDIREYDNKDIKIIKNAAPAGARSGFEEELISDEDIRSILD